MKAQMCSFWMILPLSLLGFLFLLTLWRSKSISVVGLGHFISEQLAHSAWMQPCYEVSHTLFCRQLPGTWIFSSIVKDLISSSKMHFPVAAVREHSMQLKREGWEAGPPTSPKAKGTLVSPMGHPSSLLRHKRHFSPCVPSQCMPSRLSAGPNSGLKKRENYLSVQEQSENKFLKSLVKLQRKVSWNLV